MTTRRGLTETTRPKKGVVVRSKLRRRTASMQTTTMTATPTDHHHDPIRIRVDTFFTTHSQAEISHLLGVRSLSYVSHIKSGRNVPSTLVTKRLADAMPDVTMEELTIELARRHEAYRLAQKRKRRRERR